MYAPLGQTCGLSAVTGILALPLVSSTPGIACGVWVVVFAAWWSNRDAIDDARRYSVPGLSCDRFLACVVAQYVLDRAWPLLGSSVVLFGNLAVIATVVRGSRFPSARVRR